MRSPSSPLGSIPLPMAPRLPTQLHTSPLQPRSQTDEPPFHQSVSPLQHSLPSSARSQGPSSPARAHWGVVRRQLHGRGSPDWHADGPYRLLANVVARASVRQLRRASSDFVSHPERSQRPSIQTRRSQPRVGGVGSLPPLHFDRKAWELTPPLDAHVSESDGGDYFGESSALFAQPLHDVEMPRASSAPVLASSPHRRWHSVDFVEPAEPIIAKKKSRRFAVDPSDFVAYLDPQLSAALQQRVEKSKASTYAIFREISLPEAEWSFLLPLAEVISSALTPHIAAMESCHLAEYGCYRDTPNPALKSVLDALQNQVTKTVIPVSHDCPTNFDIRPLQAALNDSPFSYRNPFTLTSFSFSEFGDVVCPPSSVDIGIGGRDLFRLYHLPTAMVGKFSSSQIAERDQLAEYNLATWLRARTQEIKSGGLLVIHLPLQITPVLVRSPRNSLLDGRSASQGSTSLWSAMLRNLEPAVQRLVSLGEIRNNIAPSLLDVAYWPRSLASLKRSVAEMSQWDILPVELSEDWQSWNEHGVRVHRLAYPAWTAFQRGEIDRATYAQRIATYCRSVYELHFKQVLRDRGKMDLGTTESTVQELFKLLQEKCEMGTLDAPKLDIGVMVLRKR